MKISLFTLLVLISQSLQAANLNNEYPPILNFYPNCSYEVIKNHSVNYKTDELSKNQNLITTNLLLKLRKKAHDIGADAVILVDKSTKRKINAARVAIFTLRYKAELIKQCEKDNNQPPKLTPYNDLGEAVISNVTISKIESNYQFNLSHNNAVQRPKIVNKEVSIENGVYGIKLGANYQSVLNVFGAPNTILNIRTNESIVGYGRRHWLHFQNDKLVKIQTSSPALSQSMINKIPFLDFFDDFQWKINNKVAYKTQLSDIRKALKITGKLTDEHQLSINNNTATLTLLFNNYKDLSKQSTHYVLNGFVLEKNNYKQHEDNVVIDRKKHFNVLATLISSLKNQKPIDVDTVKSQLGESLGAITLTKQEQIHIYNNNLFLHIKSGDLRDIALVEDLFLPNKLTPSSTTPPWYLGKFKQGESIAKLKKHFPIDSFELHDKVEVDADKYQLFLLFDEVNNEKLLYEAKLTLY